MLAPTLLNVSHVMSQFVISEMARQAPELNTQQLASMSWDELRKLRDELTG